MPAQSRTHAYMYTRLCYACIYACMLIFIHAYVMRPYMHACLYLCISSSQRQALCALHLWILCAYASRPTPPSPLNESHVGSLFLLYDFTL